MPSWVIDANVLVGLADARDHRHADARALRAAVVDGQGTPVFVDVLVAEAASPQSADCAPDHFLFVNPGTILLPLDQIRAGGRSECRKLRTSSVELPA